MFETCDLSDLAFLSLKGFPAVPTARRGNLVFFSVNLPSDEAERLLQSPEREFVGRFHQAFRRLRRTIDLFPCNGEPNVNGWVKLWRKTLGSAVFTSLPAADLKVFVASLLLANNRPRSWYNGQGEEEIPRGSFVTSQPKLAELTRLTRKQVRGALDRLQKIGAIWAKQRAKRYTVITVANFEAYQGTDDQPGQETGLPRANAGP